MVSTKPPSFAVQLQKLGVKKSHAYMIAWGKRTPNLALALKIDRELGIRLGPLAEATPEQLEVLTRNQGEAA